MQYLDHHASIWQFSIIIDYYFRKQNLLNIKLIKKWGYDQVCLVIWPVKRWRKSCFIMPIKSSC